MKLKPLIELTALLNVLSALRSSRFQPRQLLVVSAALICSQEQFLPRGSLRAAPDASDGGNQGNFCSLILPRKKRRVNPAADLGLPPPSSGAINTSFAD